MKIHITLDINNKRDQLRYMYMNLFDEVIDYLNDSNIAAYPKLDNFICTYNTWLAVDLHNFKVVE